MFRDIAILEAWPPRDYNILLVNEISYFCHKVHPGCFSYFWLSKIAEKAVIRGSRKEASLNNS